MLDIIWDQKYSVGIAEIDQQHQKFTAMLDMLFESVEAGRPKGVLTDILKELTAYAGYHFETEEQLMIKHRYPQLGAHQREHEAFRTKILEFQKSFLAGKETLTIDVVKFMTHWLADHIMTTDKKYCPFFNSKGIS